VGQLFKQAEDDLLSISRDSVFVEIGSDNNEGSTQYFAKLAKTHGVKLHTVDISPYAKNRLSDKIDNVVWHEDIGSEWASTTFPTLNKTISCLYLDNFDYIWDVPYMENHPWIPDQIKKYKKVFGIDMNNENCQIEHLKQIIALFPFIDKNGLVICDDTYQWNDCWVGKNGAVVIFLLANGYEILRKKEYGVTLINKAL
jgi:hypothetical protein